jgi:hypothetical protein
MRIGKQYEAAGNFPADMTGEPEDKQSKVQRHERLQLFGASLAKQRDEWVSARRASGWDKRIQEDLDQYHAKDNAASAAANMMNSVEQGYPVTQNHAKATRSTVYIGLTRQKSNAAEARLSDILLPTDENNWAIGPTPKPELAKMLQDHDDAVDPDTGGPLMLDAYDPAVEAVVPTRVKKSDIALAVQTQAREAAAAMEEEVKDQLVECDYNAEVRKIIHDAATMGVGVIKGPIVFNQTRRSWERVRDPETGETVYVQRVVEETRPASHHVDPRFVWEDPSCGDDIQNGAGIYELEQLTRKKVRALADQPGYMREQLAQVLEEGPQKGIALVEITPESKRDQLQKNTFDVWYYVGEINPQDAADAGMDIDPDDQLDSIDACVVMINNTVVKVYPNPDESGALPYDFYPWEKVNDSPRGYGVPWLMRSPQRVINAAWRMMMDNAAVCAGPQIIVRKGKIEPEDQTWNLYARKVWLANVADGDSVADVFTQVEFNMHQSELQNIINMGVQLADAETSTPMITQGEQGAAPETVGGMQMLLNSANVVLRRLVKQFDDYVTKPHIRRYYDYNMAYGEDDAIKGDFSVDARGSSALLVRDIQNQAFTNLLAAGANPVYSAFIDQKKLFMKALQAQHVQPQDIMKTDAEMKADAEQQAQNPPTDPRVQAATITSQAKAQESQARSASFESEIALRRDISLQNHAAAIEKLQLERDLALLKYATEEKITLQQAKKDLAIAAMNNRTKAEMAATEIDLSRDTGRGI